MQDGKEISAEEIKKDQQKIEKESSLMKEQFLERFGDFVIKGIASPTFMIEKIPAQVRLSFVQITRPEFRSTLKVGGNEIPYLKGDKAKRMLSFVTNFGWGVEEVSDERFEQFETTVKKKAQNGSEYEKKIVRFEASCRCKFWYIWNGEKRFHSCRGSFKSYENPATSKFTVLQMAQTNATKTFAADVFGIGSDLKDIENEKLNKVRKDAMNQQWNEADFEEAEVVDQQSDSSGLNAQGDL